MAKLYVFGIGGTGSRVLRSLTMLLAAGADTYGYDIVPIVIDPDHANGNLTQNITLMDEYVTIRNYLTFAGSNGNRYFSTKIEKVLSNFTMPVEKTSNLKFREFIDLDGNKVKVKLTGMCQGCKNSRMTIKTFVESILKDKVDSNLEVEQI